MPAKCPAHVREEAMRLWVRGEKATTIAAKVGVCAHTLTGWARSEGLGRPRKHHHPVHDFRDEILRRYFEERKPASWLAEVYGFDKGTLYCWLRADGLKPHSHRLSAKEASRLYRKLGTYSSVGEVLGCSKEWARKLVLRSKAGAK